MKPILFNTEMVCGIRDDLKTVTRRIVKPRYHDSVFEMYNGKLCEASPRKPPIDNGDGTTTHFVRQFVPCKPPYRPGDILYVRETWQFLPCIDCPKQFTGCDKQPVEYDDSEAVSEGCYIYKADCLDPSRLCWRPSIHMPREAARIFLWVTNAKVQRLGDITDKEAAEEGFVSRKDFIAAFLRMYPDCTEDSWVWVIKFERISKEETESETN